MKTCPYCAEEIKDEAIRCRWCHAWLVDDAPAGVDADRPPTAMTTGTATASAPATSASATSSEPTATTPTSSAPAAATTAAATGTAGAAAGSAPSGDPKVEFTHTGSRYLLGYGSDFFGIWDRNAPQQPIERFPRNDQGWASAWQRYAQIEPNWMDLRTGQKSG